MTAFEPGTVYQFTSCIPYARPAKFYATPLRRENGRRAVEFALVGGLVQGRPEWVDGSEFVRVDYDGLDYTASATCPIDAGLAADLARQIVRTSRA